MSDIAGTMEVVRDAGALAQRAAEIIAERLKTAKSPFRMVLSGGSTPRAAYQLLACKDIDWSCVELFFSDETLRAAGSPRFQLSHGARDAAGGRGCQPAQAAGHSTDGTPQSAADRYDETLRQQYGASQLEPGVPLFHLTLLGLGDDGHTASLLPGQPVLQERDRWAALVPEGRGEPRITLTYPALDSSERIIFLVSGAAKRDALAQARGGALPAGGLKPMGDVLWLVDAEAAGEEDQGYGF